MQNTRDETATVVLGNTRTRFTLILQEEDMLKHEVTTGKTNEGMSATNPARRILRSHGRGQRRIRGLDGS
ncbi:hypothetical protein Acife_0740 [Acidithiobacillus ferrivorans SS3]|uniref:Uncharacterized protein n=1 Tax=Acidithiobacillus ferrivorans SS3 TaxID=743299 RepID=G0JLY8_9PROT|nr:hypothetical protein Acife_0740 [Acidithiobacillus ferrivorans SS3]